MIAVSSNTHSTADVGGALVCRAAAHRQHILPSGSSGLKEKVCYMIVEHCHMMAACCISNCLQPQEACCNSMTISAAHHDAQKLAIPGYARKQRYAITQHIPLYFQQLKLQYLLG